MTESYKRLVKAVLGAGALITTALVLNNLTANGHIDGEFSKRAMQALIGLLLVVTGNVLPKKLEPLSEARCDPSKEQTMKRFAGKTFVVAGLGYTFAWLFVPIQYASTVSIVIVGTSVLLVGTLFIGSLYKCKRMSTSANSPSKSGGTTP